MFGFYCQEPLAFLGTRRGQPFVALRSSIERPGENDHEFDRNSELTLRGVTLVRSRDMKRTNLGKTYRHFIDTETTGLDPNVHEILEIAVVTETVDPEDPSRPTVPVTWSRKILPQHIQTASPQALAINGYDPERWKDAVPFKDIAEELADRLRDGVCVGHNVSFDLGFLSSAFKSAGFNINLGHRHVDTLTLAYTRWGLEGEIDSLSLDTLRKHLGIEIDHHHTASKDAWDCREVFHRAIKPDPFLSFTRWLRRLVSKIRRLDETLSFQDHY